MSRWKVTLRPDPREVRLLVTSGVWGDLLKARLPLPGHPRAVLGLLEGLALWAGSPLAAAITADSRWSRTSVSTLFGGEVWPPESALVHFDFVDRRSPRRIRGLGDFRAVYAAEGRDG